MHQHETNLLLDVIQVLATVAEGSGPEVRQSLHPIIDVVEFIARAVEREEPWLLGSPLLAGRWQLLAEFFEALCADGGRAECFVEEARRVVRDRGMLPACEGLLLSIRRQAARPARRPRVEPFDWPGIFNASRKDG